LVPWQTGTDAAGHAHQLHCLSNDRADLPAEVWIKEATCPSWASVNASYNRITHRGETTDQTHQEGRNYARLPGHDALWTGHYTASQQSTLSQLDTSSSPPDPAQQETDTGLTHQGRVITIYQKE
jgi:hypothetical protein